MADSRETGSQTRGVAKWRPTAVVRERRRSLAT